MTIVFAMTRLVRSIALGQAWPHALAKLLFGLVGFLAVVRILWGPKIWAEAGRKNGQREVGEDRESIRD